MEPIRSCKNSIAVPTITYRTKEGFEVLEISTELH